MVVYRDGTIMGFVPAVVTCAVLDGSTAPGTKSYECTL